MKGLGVGGVDGEGFFAVFEAFLKL